jgi:limonene-1,2-epoxide hydrolase
VQDMTQMAVEPVQVVEALMEALADQETKET